MLQSTFLYIYTFLSCWINTFFLSQHDMNYISSQRGFSINISSDTGPFMWQNLMKREHVWSQEKRGCAFLFSYYIEFLHKCSFTWVQVPVFKYPWCWIFHWQREFVLYISSSSDYVYVGSLLMRVQCFGCIASDYTANCPPYWLLPSVTPGTVLCVKSVNLCIFCEI